MFRTITQLLSFVGGVIASVKNFSDTVSKSYQRQVAGLLKAGEAFSVEWLTLFQLTVTRLMEQQRDLLHVAERVHREALRKLTRLRNRRDDLRRTLIATLQQVRATFDGTHGRGTSDLFLGLEADFARSSARVLLRYALEAIEVLLKPGFTVPDTALDNTVLTPQQYAEEIRPAAEALENTLVELDEHKRVTEEAQRVRTTVLAKARRTIIYGSRLLEALYILADQEFHSRRLRPGVGSGSVSTEGEGDGTGEVPPDAEPDTPPAEEEPDGESDGAEAGDEAGEAPSPSA